jgi:hypothetical protein
VVEARLKRPGFSGATASTKPRAVQSRGLVVLIEGVAERVRESRFRAPGGSQAESATRATTAQSVAGTDIYVPGSNGPGSEKPSIPSTFA